MIELLTGFSGLAQDALAVGFVVFLRVGAAMSVMPAFGERSVPARIRLGLTVAFTLIVAPAVSTQTIQLATSPVIWPMILATETIVGLVIGIGFRLFVFALQIAGSIAAQSTSLSQIFGAAGVDPLPAIGHLLVIAGLAIAVTLGFHVQIAGFIIRSYDLFPAGQFVDPSALSEWGIWQIAKAFGLAFTLAAPFVISSLIYNIALGVINRAMPQLMVAFVGAPAITAGGLILLFLTAPLMLALWQLALQDFVLDPFGSRQ